MKRMAPGWLAFLACLAAVGAGGARAASDNPAPNGAAAANGAAPSAQPGNPNGPPPAPRGPAGFGRGGFGGPGRAFGEVVAVRGNVLQLRTQESEGLTRVILASDAQIIGDETLTADDLKPGTKLMGMGRQVEGTGAGGVPIKVEVQTLTVQDGGGGGRFGGGGGPFFGFGGRGGPLTRGQRPDVFRKQNYSGSISFNATVRSVHPLVLVDDQGNPLPVVVGEDAEIHRRGPHPIKEGDITAGARLMATGDPTPDGLLNAHMITLLGASRGSDRRSLPGTIMAVSDKGVTVQPRFAPEGLPIEIDPAAKVYFQEKLDPNSIHIGDTLTFTGKVIAGTATAPKVLVVRTITPADQETPQIDEGGRGRFGGFGGGGFGGGFGGRFGTPSVTATVKGKVIALDPPRVQTEEGREVTLKVPGQVAYVRYRPAERTALHAGQKALFAGPSKAGGLVADLIVVNPSLAMGPGF